MAKSIDVKIDLAAQVAKAVDAYGEQMKKKVQKVGRQCAKSCCDEIKENASAKLSKGRSDEYERGWKVKTAEDSSAGYGFIVYNKDYPGLTHLLEKGHVGRNQAGTWGRVRAYPHIEEPGDKWAREYEERVNDEINKIKLGGNNGR